MSIHARRAEMLLRPSGELQRSTPLRGAGNAAVAGPDDGVVPAAADGVPVKRRTKNEPRLAG